MASRVEVSFVDESDFVIYGKGFISKDYADNLDWEVDSTISLEWNDSLDEISDFEEELRSGAEDSLNDPDSEFSSSPSATYDNGDDSDFGAGPSVPNKGGRKKPKAKSKQRAGNINRRTKKSKQPNVSLSTCEAPSTRNSNKNTKKHQANRGGNQKRKQQRC